MHKYYSIFIIIKLVLLASIFYYTYKSQKSIEELDIKTTRTYINIIMYLVWASLALYSFILVSIDKETKHMKNVIYTNIAILLSFAVFVSNAKDSINNSFHTDSIIIRNNVVILQQFLYYWLGFNAVCVISYGISHRDELAPLLSSSNRKSNGKSNGKSNRKSLK